MLYTCRGRSSIDSNDDVLSLAAPQPARLSLFDLAEAAASLSAKQPTRAQPKRQSAKAKAADKPLAVTKGPCSIRKRKESSSPEEAAVVALPASTAGMQTRGRTRRQSLDVQAAGPSPSPSPPQLEAPPARSRAAKQKQLASTDPAQLADQADLGATAQDGVLAEASTAPISKADTAGPDSMPEEGTIAKRPAGSSKKHSHSAASPATTSDSQAQTPSPLKSEMGQQAVVADAKPSQEPSHPAGADSNLMSLRADAASEPGPSMHEQAVLPVPVQGVATAEQDRQMERSGAGKAPSAADLQPDQAAVFTTATVSGAQHADPVTEKSAVKAKKRKHKKDTEAAMQPASAPDSVTEAPPAPEPDLAEQESNVPVFKQPSAHKKHKPKAKDSEEQGKQSASASQLPESGVHQAGPAAPASEEPAVKPKKHKRKRREDAGDTKQQASEAVQPAGEIGEPGPSQMPDAVPAPSVKVKKHKRKHSKKTASNPGAQAADASLGAPAAGASTQAAPVADQGVDLLAAPKSQEPSAETKKKSKKKKHRHSEVADAGKQPASASAEKYAAVPLAEEDAAVPLAEAPAPMDPDVEADPEDPADKPQKKKKKRKHSDVAGKAKMPASEVPTTAAEEPADAPASTQAPADLMTDGPDVKPKKRSTSTRMAQAVVSKLLPQLWNTQQQMQEQPQYNSRQLQLWPSPRRRS